MQMFYSATTNGFYSVEIHGDKMPLDVVEVSKEIYDQCKGRDLIAGSDGLPVIRQPAPPTFDERAAGLLAIVDEHLNAAAKAKGYDSITTAALRAALPASPFHDDGIAFGSWMDQVYATCYQLLGKVKAGELDEPNAVQLIAMLPPGPVFEK